MNNRKNNTGLLAFWLFVFTIYVYFISFSWPNLAAGDQMVQRYELTRSFVEKQELSIPANMEGIKGIDGKDYSFYGPGLPILAVPFYLIGKSFGRSPDIVASFVSLLNPFVGAATVVVVFLFSSALGYTRRASLIVALFYGLGTLAWPLTKHPFDHTVETLLVLLSMYSMVLYRTIDRLKYIIISAVCFGVAINTRLVSALTLPALLILLLSNERMDFYMSECRRKYFINTLIFMAALLPFAGMVLFYNLIRFGSIFETGYQLYATKTGVEFFSGTSLLTGLHGFLLSPGKGFFFYSPITLLFFFALIPFFKRQKYIALSFSILIVSYLVFHSKLLYWHGDWAWGPRYLLAITPYFVLPVGEILDSDPWKNKYRLIRYLVYPLITVSFLIQIAAVSVHFYKYFFHLNIDKRIQFIRIEVNGVPTVNEPPFDVYFDWTKSPIVAQFQYIEEIGSEMKTYRYVEPATNTFWGEKIRAHPIINVYDFWWVYMYYVKRSVFGFAGLSICLSIVFISGLRMNKLLRS